MPGFKDVTLYGCQTLPADPDHSGTPFAMFLFTISNDPVKVGGTGGITLPSFHPGDHPDLVRLLLAPLAPPLRHPLERGNPTEGTLV